MKEGKKNDKEQKSREEEQKIQEEERAMHLKKEKENMVFGFETTLLICLMPFYIHGYESKYYSDDKEIAFYQHVRKQYDLDRMIGLFSLLNNFEFLIHSLAVMDRCYPNFQVVFVQKK